MGHWLAPPGAAKQLGDVKRFDARYWTVNFPRPMMASVVTTASDALRVDAIFYRADDLAGLIWEAEDRFDHPLLAYETSRDFRACRLSFRWRSGGLMPLDAINGPTLTIEGLDADGTRRGWYVRLWNYAQGTPEDALIRLDFGNLNGGFLLPDEADPVWAGDIDRMFISLIPPGYTAQNAPLAAPAEAWVEISGIASEGPGSVLSIGETMVPELKLRIASGYDDSYNLTPARLLRNVMQLGYREVINHYVGMSHYFRLEAQEDGGLQTSADGGALNVACAAWHRDFCTRAKALGYEIILSLSYELFDAHCPEEWKQRAENGEPGLTGWVPPSCLLSPAHAGAMAYLQAVARAFVGIAADAGQRVRFQVGEPWWVMPDGRICLYDDAAVEAFSPVPIANVRAPLSQAQRATLDAAGEVLSASTAALCQAVKSEAPEAQTLLLVYLPTVLEGAEVKRANVPLGWAAPAFDVLQLEDYDWVTSGSGATERGVAAAGERLAYPMEDQHYFSGFVLRPDQRAQWQPIADAVEAARQRGTSEVFVWALPQVLRDGFIWFDGGEGEVDAFDDVRFPIALGREASVEPSFSTAVVMTANGAEQRNSDWADARLRFDAGPGVRGEAELRELIAFFRARRGAAIGFRFEDPFDHSSNGMTGEIRPTDQLLGIGDGLRTQFALVKHYGTQERRITRPVEASVRVAIGGIEQVSGWTLGPGGMVRFDAAPAADAEVRAGFRFDVPVRFAEDRLSLSRATFEAGEIASVPLIEIREDAFFEDFQLADYGNRIPSLTFEVIADAGPVTVGAIAEELSDGEIVGGETPELEGYAAAGSGVRGAVEALADVVPLSLAEENGRLKLSAAGAATASIGRSECNAAGAKGSGGRSEFSRRSAVAIPGEVSIAYHDVARDYQTGLQRAIRGAPGQAVDRRSLSAALRADAAKSLAEQRLAALWAARETGQLHLAWRRSGVRPGDRLQIEGQAGLWKVARWTLDRMVARLELVRVPGSASPVGIGASPGRPVGSRDLKHGPTTFLLFEVPAVGEVLASNPQVFAAAAGIEPGWRSASLSSSYDGGESWTVEGVATDAAVMGRAATVLGPAGSALIDCAGAVEIELLNEAMWLEGRGDALLVAGANLAMLGDELIQFGVAEPLGSRRFRLSRLLRGRRGTEWAATEHVAGEPFILIEREKLVAINPPWGSVGGEVRLMAQGIGDGEGAAIVSHAIEGRALQPPAPVHLRAERLADGAISISWVRRSRIGWSWLSGTNTPLGEEAESYRLRLSNSGFEREVVVAEPFYIYTAEQQAADGLTGLLLVQVSQVGTHASSRRAQLVLS